ncbi:MAG: stage V sporulation protein K, partial [Desulfitobacterium hafniense]|nr:stage V sporulation protein K [Desulfitobacterium hafniense]
SEARDELTKILIRKLTGQSRYEGNARLVRNLIEKAIRKQALRLININDTKREDLMLITKTDILHSLDEVRSV